MIVEPGSGEMVRVRATLAYDGTGYSGWARQPGRMTVQGDLEEALRRIDTAIGPVTCAGRTDAGVHARGQVVHFDVPHDLWRRRGAIGLGPQLNHLLGDRIHIRHAQAAPAGFDARFSALSRSYTYRISDHEGEWDPLSRHWVTVHRSVLDASAMARAAPELIGEHDFAAFCRGREGASTVRRVLRLEVHRDGRRRVLVTIEADAFCHSMVRAIVGALVVVGEGRRDPAWVGQVLALGVRDSAVTVMPPQGLVLEAVAYPPDDFVAERAAVTRRPRGQPSECV